MFSKKNSFAGDLADFGSEEPSRGVVQNGGAEFNDQRFESYEDTTVTLTVTKDVFETVTNLIYNSIPVTLTNMVKTTVTLPISKVGF